MTEEDEEDYTNNNIWRFCQKNIESVKVPDHCHLTGRYRGPAHNKSTFNVTQDQTNFIPFVFHSFSNYDCHFFLKELVDKKMDKLKFKILPKTDEKYFSVKNRCVRFIDSYRLLSSNLDSLFERLIDKRRKNNKNFERRDCW